MCLGMVEYYSAIKKSECKSSAGNWTNREATVLSEISQSRSLHITWFLLRERLKVEIQNKRKGR